MTSTAEPGVDNFRVSYGNLSTGANVGFVEVHASRVGQVATINYRGVGVNLNASFRSDAKANLQRSVIVNGAVVCGSVTVGNDSIPASLELNARLQNVGDAVADNDAVPLSQLTTLSNFYVNELRDRVAALYA